MALNISFELSGTFLRLDVFIRDLAKCFRKMLRKFQGVGALLTSTYNWSPMRH